MGALLRIRGQKVILRKGLWRCANTVLETELTQVTESWIRETGGPPISSADPEFEVAREMVRRYRGKLLSHVPTRGKEAARMYFRKRQLLLFAE